MQLRDVIARLHQQVAVYQQASLAQQQAMARRALGIAGQTIRRQLEASYANTTKLPPLRTAAKFVFNRQALWPDQWGALPKAGFARALCGYSLGPDAVCVDTWLRRNGIRPADAVDQWTLWFKLYRLVYGERKYQTALKIHLDWLKYVAGGGSCPTK